MLSPNAQIAELVRYPLELYTILSFRKTPVKKVPDYTGAELTLHHGTEYPNLSIITWVVVSGSFIIAIHMLRFVNIERLRVDWCIGWTC
jgi:hypothetical protein